MVGRPPANFIGRLSPASEAFDKQLGSRPTTLPLDCGTRSSMVRKDLREIREKRLPQPVRDASGRPDGRLQRRCLTLPTLARLALDKLRAWIKSPFWLLTHPLPDRQECRKLTSAQAKLQMWSPEPPKACCLCFVFCVPFGEMRHLLRPATKLAY